MSRQEHPCHTRSHIYEYGSIGALAADKLTAFTGSWWFLFLHGIWFGLWIGLKVEPFPYGLLTMIVSLEAIGLSTLVMMSQNRQSEKDHKRDDLEADEVAELLQLNRTQKEILDLLKLQSEARLRKKKIPTELPAN